MTQRPGNINSEARFPANVAGPVNRDIIGGGGLLSYLFFFLGEATVIILVAAQVIRPQVG